MQSVSTPFFDASVLMSDSVERLVLNSAQQMTERAVIALASHYGFDAQEALALLNLSDAKVVRRVDEMPRVMSEKAAKREKPATAKATGEKFQCPLPYSGKCDETLCHALLQNQQQYTQCKKSPVNGGEYCKSCQTSADANNGIPEYGTIEQRQAVDIFEYVTPKGRKPLAFANIMKKYGVTREQVLEEAGKQNIEIDERHFEEPVKETKKGRPKAEVAEKKSQGRPKKEKKVVEIAGEEEDLFAALVSSANSDDEEEASSNEEEISAKEQEKAAAKAAKELAKEQEKAAAKAAKELAKEQEKAAAKEQEKAAAKEQEKVSAKPAKEQEPAEEETYKKKTIDEVAYIMSKQTNILYEYETYKNTQELVVVGRWNKTENRMEKIKNIESSDEEEEEEYDEEEEE